jgi:predicted alpha/beta hydrolase family esterase
MKKYRPIIFIGHSLGSILILQVGVLYREKRI